MLDITLLGRFLEGVRGQALVEGYRYCKERRVGPFIGSPSSVTAVVRGKTGDFEVVLWEERKPFNTGAPALPGAIHANTRAAAALHYDLKEQARGGRLRRLPRTSFALPSRMSPEKPLWRNVWPRPEGRMAGSVS